MSSRTKTSKTLASQSSRAVVKGSKYASSSSSSKKSSVDKKAERLASLGLDALLKSNFPDQDERHVVRDFVSDYSDNFIGKESYFNDRYRLKALVECIKLHSDGGLEEAITFINEIKISSVILIYQTIKLLSDTKCDDIDSVIDYVVEHKKYFDLETLVGRSRLVEFGNFMRQSGCDLSKLEEDIDIDSGAPTKKILSLRKQVTECQSIETSVKGVENLGYCTECGSKILIVTEIQDRCSDEQKSIYISCANCGKRGDNIKYNNEE